MSVHNNQPGRSSNLEMFWDYNPDSDKYQTLAIFTSFKSFTLPTNSPYEFIDFDYLVVGGGGAGGTGHATYGPGGGGGAGGVATGTIRMRPGDFISCSVGAGGSASATAGNRGGNGGASTLSHNARQISAAGGGGGGGALQLDGNQGGCGGGGGSYRSAISNAFSSYGAGGNSFNNLSNRRRKGQVFGESGKPGNPGGGGAGGSALHINTGNTRTQYGQILNNTANTLFDQIGTNTAHPDMNAADGIYKIFHPYSSQRRFVVAGGGGGGAGAPFYSSAAQPIGMATWRGGSSYYSDSNGADSGFAAPSISSLNYGMGGGGGSTSTSQSGKAGVIILATKQMVQNITTHYWTSVFGNDSPNTIYSRDNGTSEFEQYRGLRIFPTPNRAVYWDGKVSTKTLVGASLSHFPSVDILPDNPRRRKTILTLTSPTSTYVDTALSSSTSSIWQRGGYETPRLDLNSYGGITFDFWMYAINEFSRNQVDLFTLYPSTSSLSSAYQFVYDDTNSNYNGITGAGPRVAVSGYGTWYNSAYTPQYSAPFTSGDKTFWDNWHHWVVAITSTSCKIYQNGEVLVDNTGLSGTWTTRYNQWTNTAAYIRGGFMTGFVYRYASTGALGRFRVYQGIPTDKEVKRTYNAEWPQYDTGIYNYIP